MSEAGQRGVPTEFAEQVLDLVARIPAGRVLAYGDVARMLGGGGPRQVGAALARFGAGVPWHRVIHADGTPPPGHEAQARARWREEGTPLTADGSRVRMHAARWAGPQAPS
jgi:alkylated DNA nucleotide flippase Atl1